MDTKISESDVKCFLNNWVEAYEKSDEEWFDSFTEDSSVFSVSIPTRIDGIKEFKRGFGDQFHEHGGRRSQVLSPEIRVFEDSALVTYHNRVATDAGSSNLRVTLLLARTEKGRLQVVHMHASPLIATAVTGVSTPSEKITVLEERVATAIAAVGTPK